MQILPIIFIDSLRVMIFILVQVLIAITNTILMKRLGKFAKAKRQPKVSILVPARNEQETIANCVKSLLSQKYENYEVIVLNDNSQDRTGEILKSIQSERLRIIEGKPLPKGWIGKSWASQQLATEANSEFIFFTDADTIHQPMTVPYAVEAMETGNIDLVTGIIGSKTITFGELITVPFPTWSIFTILPLVVAYTLPRSTAFSAANGKFMFFRKKVYDKIGGHAAIKENAVEDIELAKLVKKNGYKWRLLDASRLVSCRMYHNFSEALDGFTKNYFALFGYKILIAVFVWCWMALITFYPIVTLFKNSIDRGFWYAVFSMIGTGLLWFLTSVKFGFPLYLFLLYPLIISISIFIGIRSMFLTITGKTIWKGRRIEPSKIRWL